MRKIENKTFYNNINNIHCVIYNTSTMLEIEKN